MKLKKVLTADGSFTLYDSNTGDFYHSTFGAVQESKHIYINTGFNKIDKPELNILEIGLGTGLNAFLTLVETKNKNIQTIYHSIELFPIDLDLCLQLNFAKIINEDPELFKLIHTTPWNKEIRINNNFVLKKIKSDLREMNIIKKYELIYFDAFCPDKQPEMWTYDIFINLYNSLHKKGILVTYSVKGIVKRLLKSVGFNIELLPGPPGKRHIIRATKN